MGAEAIDEYVCPKCGMPARGASVCASCETNLDAYHALPLRSEFEAGGVDAISAQYENEINAYATPGAPGGVLSRWGATIIDSVLGLFIAIVCAILFSLVTSSETAAEAVIGVFLAFWYLLYPPLMLAFRNGQTIGKRVMAVRVENANGQPIGLGRAFIRESLIKFPFHVFGLLLIDAIVARASARRLSIHDRLTGTHVVTTS